jgi:hypothetical protein
MIIKIIIFFVDNPDQLISTGKKKKKKIKKKKLKKNKKIN